MATITSGTSARVVLEKNSQISITCASSGTIRRTKGASLLDSVAQGATTAIYGPYTSRINFDISAIGGDITYTTSAGTGEYSVGAVDDLAAATGQTPDQVVAAIKAASYAKGIKTIAICGDSISNNMTAYSAGSYDFTSSHGWAGWAPALAGVQVKILSQFPGRYALGGLTTATYISGGYLANVVADTPDIAAVMLGTNDAIGTQPGIAVTKANLITIWQAMLDANIYVLAYSVIPNSITSGGRAQSNANYITATNNFIREWWQGVSGGRFVDCYSLMCDSTAANSPAKANVLSDLTHPTTLGGWYMAQPVAPILSELCAAIRLVASSNDYIVGNAASNQIMVNPLMSGTGGYCANGATTVGGAPSNYNWLGDNGTTTMTVEIGGANSDIGKKAVMTVTVGGATGFIFAGSNDTITARTVVGNILRGGCRLRVKAGATTAINSIRFYWQDSTINSSWNTSQDAKNLPITTDTDFYILTPETASVNLGALSLNLRVDFAGAGACVIELEQIELRDLSLANIPI